MAAARKGKIVGGNERGQLVVAMEPGNQFKNRVRCAAVEVSGRLIRQQKLGLGDKRPGQSHTLLFTAGKFSRPVMRALLQTHLVQPSRSFSLRLRLGKSPQQKRHGHVFQCRKFRQQVVELPDETELMVAEPGRVIF